MNQISINHKEARDILTSAIATAKAADYKPKHSKHQVISDVMLGQHLTYRYILFTNLLAKATNGAVSGLALQAGAEFEGAFDSRSLCHKVVVEFDRDVNQLAGTLGRSNEPYLNKPARYPALTAENAVRKGYDRSILEKCIDILGGLESEADARIALEDAVYYTMQRESLVAEAAELKGDATLHKALMKFASAAVQNSCEGESCVIVTGLCFFMLTQSDGRAFEIHVHPSNQAGSSSREVLDIDVYISDQHLLHAAEVKDKAFNIHDVDHAAFKVKQAGLDRFFFVCGPQARESARKEFVEIIADSGVKVSFVDIEQLFSMSLALATKELNSHDVWAFIEASMSSARVKDSTRTHIINCASDAGLINSSD